VPVGRLRLGPRPSAPESGLASVVGPGPARAGPPAVPTARGPDAPERGRTDRVRPGPARAAPRVGDRTGRVGTGSGGIAEPPTGSGTAIDGV